MELSIVLPAYNEAVRIAESLETIKSFCERSFERWEILVVDDGSKDDTASIAESVEGVRVIRNEVNLGKGQTVRRGMLAAKLDWVLFSDVDLSTPIEESIALLEAVIEQQGQVAIASRRRVEDKTVKRVFLRKLMASTFRGLVKLVVLRGIHDTQCGFKIFQREAARQAFPLQQLDGWAFDVELLFIARKLGYSIVEVPVEWTESDDSRLTFWSPFQMAMDLFRIRWFQILGRYRPRS